MTMRVSMNPSLISCRSARSGNPSFTGCGICAVWNRLAAGSRFGGITQPAASRGLGEQGLRQQIGGKARLAQVAAW